MTPFETASGMLVYLIGSAIQGTLGFGANLFAVPILALVNPGFVPGPVLIINPILTTILTFRERGHVDGEALGWSLTGRLPGIVIGVVALNLVSEDQLGMLFGVLLLGAVGLKVCGLHPRRTRCTLLAAGTTSGFMGTAVGVGGPPVAMVLSDLPGPAFRATICLVPTAQSKRSRTTLTSVCTPEESILPPKDDTMRRRELSSMPDIPTNG